MKASMSDTDFKFSESKCYVFGYCLNGDGSGQAATGFTAGDKPLWLHIDYSEPDSVEWLTQLGIPENVTESLVRLDTRPRTMVIGNGILVFLRAINMNPDQSPDDMVSLRLWIEKNRMISVRQRRILSTQDIKRELENGVGPNDIQELLVFLLERLADRIADYVDSLEEAISSHEEAVENAEPSNVRIQVSSLRRQAAMVRRYLAPQRDALDALSRQAKFIMSDDHLYQIHEQSDRIVRYVEDLDLVRERAMVLQEELMNRIAQEQNARMYVLSIIAAIFLPISFVTGLFGMNVAGLPGIENPQAFLLVGMTMVAMVTGIVVFFRSNKWL